MLGVTAASQAWLRSSPIFFSVDAVVFYLQILKLLVQFTTTWKTALRSTFKGHFKHLDNPVDKINHDRNWAAAKCILFVVGAHSNPVKLLAAAVPWTTAARGREQHVSGVLHRVHDLHSSVTDRSSYLLLSAGCPKARLCGHPSRAIGWTSKGYYQQLSVFPACSVSHS